MPVPLTGNHEKIDSYPAFHLICYLSTFSKDLDHISNIDGGNLIFSIWQGYKHKKDTKQFLEYLTRRKFSVIDLHTSGHAGISTLKAMVNAVKPKHLVPIHTFQPNEYKNIFNVPVLELADGQAVNC